MFCLTQEAVEREMTFFEGIKYSFLKYVQKLREFMVIAYSFRFQKHEFLKNCHCLYICRNL